MGVYLSAMMADWPRLADRLSREATNRIGDLSWTHKPDETPWSAKYACPVPSHPSVFLHSNLTALIQAHRSWLPFAWADIAEGADEVIELADRFARGLLDGAPVTVEPAEAQRWARETETIQSYTLWAHSPAVVAALRADWQLLSPGVTTLRPGIEAQLDEIALSGDYGYKYIEDFDTFEQLLRSWGTFVEHAYTKGWGITIDMG